MNEIGKNLLELRKKKGITVRALAKELTGISYNTISAYERGQIIPTLPNASKLCEYFQVPMEYLLYGKKVTARFNDTQLYKLFEKIDGYGEEEKKIVKGFLKKVIKNVEERESLKKETV